ncbi:hypothetical protein FRB95_010305 [Tulasnella sp. JGI-2019a]|nr:hypothetical protein FRB95_010305 [Tulasnella sp. JGI-2019a]
MALSSLAPKGAHVAERMRTPVRTQSIDEGEHKWEMGKGKRSSKQYSEPGVQIPYGRLRHVQTGVSSFNGKLVYSWLLSAIKGKGWMKFAVEIFGLEKPRVYRKNQSAWIPPSEKKWRLPRALFCDLTPIPV